ncbi:MAG: ABC transporter permease, partial [Proteobacteria bacterium]|nr:ABC transporter permease [Pseudomonadota bacterium]
MAKEFIQLLRDRTTFSMIIMIPLMQLLLFGYALNTDPKHMPTALLIRDHSIFSRSFLAGLKNSEYFDITREATSEEEANFLIQEGKVLFVVSIPENFGRDLVRGTRPAILVEADATDPVATGGALGALNGILTTVLNRDLTGQLSSLRGKLDPVELRVQKRYNP